MTALKQFLRLEAPGIWREGAEAQRRAVIVSFGDATLVIADDRSARALAHWSLAALVRLNPGKRPALYAPSEEPGEELEIEDATLIDAIEKVQRAIEARRPHPGRLRGMLTAGAVGLVALGVLLWLPGALTAQAARVAPMAKRTEIGRAVLVDLERATGAAACHSKAGDAALAALAGRLPDTAQIAVLPRGLTGGRRLPGKIVALGRDTIAGPDTPEVAAGAVIEANLAAAGHDPLLDFLRWAGVRSAFSLLVTGELPRDAVSGYGAHLLDTAPPLPPEAALLAAFGAAGVSSTPWAYARDASGESVLSLIEADPFKGRPAPDPVLADEQWVALQGICD